MPNSMNAMVVNKSFSLLLYRSAICAAAAMVFMMSVVGSAAVLAEEESTPNTSSSSGNAPAQPESDNHDINENKSKRVLEGGVKGTAIPFEEGLAKISIADQAVQESCMKIMKESTRKDTVVMRGPNVLPGGVVIPALGGVGGVMQFGEMPIRRERLMRWIEESSQNIAAMQTYIDALIIPSGNVQAEAAYGELRNLIQNAQDHLNRLKELSSGKRLVNVIIGREALAIHDTMTSIERNRSQLASFVQPTEVLIESPPIHQQ